MFKAFILTLCLQIKVIEEKQYDDAFTIQSVDQPLEEIFNFMAGMVPFIQKLVKDVRNTRASNPLIRNTAIYIQLYAFCRRQDL